MRLNIAKIMKAHTKHKIPAGVLGGMLVLLLISFQAAAQGDAKAGAQLDVRQISVGDQARLFINIEHNPAASSIQWAVIPDTFNNLEVVERGRIDTLKQGSMVTYRQRLLITGFDSGVFKIPPFVFSVIPKGGTPYTIQTDSFPLVVQSVAVDTTKGFKGIKGIIYVKSSWRDYLGLLVGGLLFLVLLVFVIIYFVKNRKAKPKPQGPVESLQDYALRLLSELEARQLWQKKQVKEYYVQLTDIVRNYIEHRFGTAAMELTTDEMLAKSLELKEMQPYHDLLAQILQTADLAKFAKFQPLPQEHTDTMEKARQFISTSRPVVAEPQVQSGPGPVITETNTDKTNPSA